MKIVAWLVLMGNLRISTLLIGNKRYFGPQQLETKGLSEKNLELETRNEQNNNQKIYIYI